MIYEIISKMPMKRLLLLGVTGYYAKTLCYDRELGLEYGIKDNVLGDIVKIFNELGLHKMAITAQVLRSQNILRSTSPIKLYKRKLVDYKIENAHLESDLIKFYRNIFTEHRGLTSSFMNYSEGKTTSILQVLSEIETKDTKDSNILYMHINAADMTLENAFRQTLNINKDLHVSSVLSNISRNPLNLAELYTIYGCVDQIERFTEDDRLLLNNFVNGQHYNLKIHFPSAKEEIALRMNTVNGMQKAKYVTTNLQGHHKITLDEARNFAKTFLPQNFEIDDFIECSKQQYLKFETHQKLSPRILVDYFNINMSK